MPSASRVGNSPDITAIRAVTARRAFPVREALAFSALLLHFMVFYCNNAMFVLRLEPREALILPGAAHMLGVVLCALACPLLERRSGLMTALAVLLVASRLPGFEGWLHQPPARLLMTFAYGLSIPLTYSVFFAGVRHTRRGLAYGLCVGCGIFATAAFLLVSGIPPPADAAASAVAPSIEDGRLEWLFSLHRAGFIALALVLLILSRLRQAEHEPEAASPHKPDASSRIEPDYPERAAHPAAPGVLAIFLVTAGVFYLLNGFLGAAILPVFGHRPFDGAQPWYLLVSAAACPVIGWFLDRWPDRAFTGITRVCAFSLILAPSLVALYGQPAVYAVVHQAGTAAQLVFSLAMTFAAVRLAGRGPTRCLVLCSVYILHTAALPGMWLFRQSAGISEGAVVVLSTMAAVVLYELIGRICVRPEAETGAKTRNRGWFRARPEPELPGNGKIERNAALFLSRGLTPRECEVAALLLRGFSTRAIAEQLEIAEHTAKTHVRNLLAKFGVSNRKAFMAAMIDT